MESLTLAASRTRGLTHVTGTFLIPATGAFLNGAGLGSGDDRNVTIPKTFRDGKNEVPYVSAQAWKRWLRNTVIEEADWPKSEIVQIGTTGKGTTNKIGGMMDPVIYPEDDIFGYMRAERGQGKAREEAEQEEGEPDEAESPEELAQKPGQRPRVKSIMRASPFMASLLISIRNSGWQGRDEGFVHLQEGTPQPYATRFYNTHLQGVFCLNYARLCSFSNLGDRIELEEEKVKQYLKQGKIREATEVFREADGKKVSIGKIFELENAAAERKRRAAAVISALAVLRGGAKQAAFGTPVDPQAIVLAGLSNGNPIFHHLFRDNEKGPEIKTDALSQIISDYSDRIVTPVLIGIRNQYLSNEADVRAMNGMTIKGTNVQVMSPREAAEGMSTIVREL